MDIGALSIVLRNNNIISYQMVSILILYGIIVI